MCNILDVWIAYSIFAKANPLLYVHMRRIRSSGISDNCETPAAISKPESRKIAKTWTQEIWISHILSDITHFEL
jgi:hypothetical protein